jgi:hypothetical protein
MQQDFVLPMVPIEATVTNPQNLIIFSKPKTGKTTLVSGLKNALLLDFEKGSKYVAAMKIEVDSIDDIKIIGKKIKEANYPYDYVIIDTLTALEEKCVDYAEELYSKVPIGKNWFEADREGHSGKATYGNILNLPQGAGYYWLREAFIKVVDYIKTWAPNIIQLGHVKDAQLGKEGAEFNALDLDLTGKIKRIASGKSDAIGYLYRKGNQNVLSFATTDKVICGARPTHLRNKQIVLSELTPEGEMIFHWDEIYIK